jgi:dUTP pyrophosphatase
MSVVSIKLKRLHPSLGDIVSWPTRMSPGASGFDLAACIEEPISLLPQKIVMIPCGFALEIPLGYEGQVRSRSGLASKHQVVVTNSPGTIDSDYRGEVKVLLSNLGDKPFSIDPGMRIAQLVFQPVPLVALEVVEELDISQRGEQGFGSTGVR